MLLFMLLLLFMTSHALRFCTLFEGFKALVSSRHNPYFARVFYTSTHGHSDADSLRFVSSFGLLVVAYCVKILTNKQEISAVKYIGVQVFSFYEADCVVK